MTTPFRESWPAFVTALQTTILPRLAAGGVRPVETCRTVLFAEYMARHYKRVICIAIDPVGVRYPAAFRRVDLGGLAGGGECRSGEDADRCYDYLARETLPGMDAPMAAERARKIADYLTDPSEFEVHGTVVHDAALLEASTAGAVPADELYFPGRAVSKRDDELRQELKAAFIAEAHRWRVTSDLVEDQVDASPRPMDELLALLEAHPGDFPLLSSVRP